MKNNFNEVQKKNSKKETVNIKNFTGQPTKQFFECFDFIKTLKVKIYKLKCFQKNKKWGGELNNCRNYEEG